MPAGSGRLFTIYVGDGGGPETFSEIGSLRSTDLTRTGELVDVTTKDTAGERQLLSGGGTKTSTVTGSGVFKDTASEESLRQNYDDQLLHNYQVRTVGNHVNEFAAQITSLAMTGEFNGAQEFSVTLEVSDAVIYTP